VDEERGDDDKRDMEIVERQLRFQDILKVVGHVEVVKLYMFLLERYRTLDGPTVHAVAKFLHRMSLQLKLEPMLYQVRRQALMYMWCQFSAWSAVNGCTGRLPAGVPAVARALHHSILTSTSAAAAQVPPPIPQPAYR
jgi:hypothetical protein